MNKRSEPIIFLVVAPSLSVFNSGILSMFKKEPNEVLTWKKSIGHAVVGNHKFIWIRKPEDMRGFQGVKVIYWGDYLNMERIDEFKDLQHFVELP